MKKLSEIKDEEALDVLVDLLDPVVEIFGDKKIAEAYRSGNRVKTVQMAIKEHKKAVITMMAVLEGVPVEDFHCNLFTLPKQLLTIFNDPELTSFFDVQGEKDSVIPSGSVTETTTDGADTL